MKKLLICFLFLFLSILLIGCELEFGTDQPETPPSPITHSILISEAVENGEITSDKEKAIAGERITLTANPNTGYKLDSYFINNHPIQGNTFLMLNRNVVVDAIFIQESYTITVSDTIINGIISVNEEKAHYGDEITVNVYPAEGYTFEGLFVNEEKSNSSTFLMPAQDVTLTATFVKYDETCDHDYSSEILKAATCTEDGTMLYVCTKCGDSYSETIPALGHDFVDGVCTRCGELENPIPTPTIPNEIKQAFGDIKLYDASETNPYGINVSNYGSDVKVGFYTPNLTLMNPYENTTTQSFYKTYQPATCYEDAYYRTQMNLMSGDITPQSHLPLTYGVKENGKYLRSTTAIYVLDTSGNYLAYLLQHLDGTNSLVYYGAAYQEMNEVAAYLLAFGWVPANSNYASSNSGKSSAINDWGQYGRVNIADFSGDTSRYPYEPELPYIMYSSGDQRDYTETDFGSIGGFDCNGTVSAYNEGYSIARGTCRFVFVSDKNVKSIDKRYVFYTYNHYNDFQEYLNYYGGWGERFGNETAGNSYNKVDHNDVVQYPDVLFKTYSNIILNNAK